MWLGKVGEALSAGSRSWAAGAVLPGSRMDPAHPNRDRTCVSKASPARACGNRHPQRCRTGPAGARLWIPVARLYQKTLLSPQKSAGTRGEGSVGLGIVWGSSLQ